MVDVVVLGAGAAGLAAARRLQDSGLDLVVLEARDRLGGRILTHRSPDIPVAVELGAEFLHGEAPRTRELLREAGVDVVDIEPEQWEARDGAIRPARMFQDVRRVMARLDANRDPDRWERPDEYDIDRPPKPMLGFGGGPHICLGMHVARAEADDRWSARAGGPG